MMMKRNVVIVVLALLLGACHEPAFTDLSPQGMCERVIRDSVAYVGVWKTTCTDDPNALPPGWLGACYCHRGSPPETWEVVVSVLDYNPADPQYDIAWRVAHEYGHAWHTAYDPDYDPNNYQSSEKVANEFAEQHIRPTPIHTVDK